MKTYMEKMTDLLADAALLEMGVGVPSIPALRRDLEVETLEENLIEVAYAEAADYDEIHEAILREHRSHQDDRVHPDDCQHGDNDLCFV